MIRSGEIHDWAEAAKLVGVTRARMTQIANLLLLAPVIQENILSLPPVLEGRGSITEHGLRAIAGLVDWQRQDAAWAVLPHPVQSTEDWMREWLTLPHKPQVSQQLRPIVTLTLRPVGLRENPR
jgi:hypothetical protein